MANHVRRQLREAVQTALTGLTTTSTRVHPYRAHALQLTDLPALIVRTPNDEAENATVHAPATIDRTVNVVITGLVAGTADIDDTLDTIAKEVETALASGVTIGSRVIPLAYQGADVIDPEPGEEAVARIDLRFAARIFNAANAPDAFT